ncbi:uncharacterized protein LOC6620119 isoform X2 [Drosophila sechellia]|uniref:uncharacterized protein LOC6620119 isoform X2 n=1 Tax=Drosophila sechellia TaxID=7238 RepID=UPI0013DE75C8|nr:uncharacterized protein LOC6620119 isoform X2 [Drosophila sechellia]XP_032579913.1 uncharacterized protein LOC6620119 isoform X2 [Drosophila sechellia]XP_032579914.1 uncharacterized protein LOC6620119 isoform X2 [Drosophila sechellia]XP_032579915.1 uncharacterized protein LOC6620119 isoform X2 [Drosophila sechellia]
MDTLSPNSSKISSGNELPSKKSKSKKTKTNAYDNQNINMKKSFTKFDDLQKRNVIHVRSRDSKKAQSLFRSTTPEKVENCHQCKKPVYKMEEVILRLKTATTIFHKTCLRCKDCGKHLKFDGYNVHDGSLYCSMHFKLIFAPKVVYEEFAPRKPELIIRENQPIKLPPDVAKASDKPSLGLDELQELNLRSKCKVFENGYKEHNNNLRERQDIAIMHSKSIQSTLTKLHKLGIPNAELTKLDDNNNSDNNYSDDESNTNFMCLKKEIERETPVGLGEAMNDIRSKFEQGDLIAKEGRREERKQEIQNIRSRLFLGKQAKIKEMYKLAVAESEQAVTSVGKTPDICAIKPTQEIKNRFENGEVYKDSKILSSEVSCGIHADADVFESGISKASRNIFMELDANIISSLSNHVKYTLPNTKYQLHNQKVQENSDVDIVKSDSKPEEVKAATEELSRKFKFFETYSPAENKKGIFRMTPPREGVVMFPPPDSDTNQQINTTLFNDNVLQKTKTTSTILNKFREMEEKKMSDEHKEKTPKPMKCFTPPPEISHQVIRSDTEEESQSDYEQNSENDEMQSEIVPSNSCYNDKAFLEAQSVARAKQLRAKFEKWQKNEIEQEIKEGRVDVYSQLISNESIESAKTIRERFENMKKSETAMENTSKTQIKRFV